MANSTFSDREADFRVETGIDSDDMGPIQTAFPAANSMMSDEGPCLYLGPEGQRCYRPAVKSGFCAAHQPGAALRGKIGKPSKKVVAAAAGIAGVLWPYLYDFVHALIRLLHPK
ncbi:MAG: hypothetical protein WBQ34_12230 [Candidatus Acidiferrales bacterium]